MFLLHSTQDIFLHSSSILFTQHWMLYFLLPLRNHFKAWISFCSSACNLCMIINQYKMIGSIRKDFKCRNFKLLKSKIINYRLEKMIIFFRCVCLFLFIWCYFFHLGQWSRTVYKKVFLNILDWSFHLWFQPRKPIKWILILSNIEMDLAEKAIKISFKIIKSYDRGC